MNTETALEGLVRAVASDWLNLSDPVIAERLLADPLLVLGPDGTTPVPRAAFLAAITSRTEAVARTDAPQPMLDDVSAVPLGDRIVVATASWTFRNAAGSARLVSDFLLVREGQDALRCAAYLPRTNVLDHL